MFVMAIPLYLLSPNVQLCSHQVRQKHGLMDLSEQTSSNVTGSDLEDVMKLKSMGVIKRRCCFLPIFVCQRLDIHVRFYNMMYIICVFKYV